MNKIEVDIAQADFNFIRDNRSGEQWVVDEWIAARGLNKIARRPVADPPDFLVGGEQIEVVFCLKPGRRLHGEYKLRLEKVISGESLVAVDLTARGTNLQEVLQSGASWLIEVIRQKEARYSGCKSAQDWILLVYANFGWTHRVDWDKVRNELAVFPPPFYSVQALHHTGAGRCIVSLWDRPK